MQARTLLLRVWGVYYVATGVWPLVHMASFEAVTGPKSDDWLVHMVGLLAAAIGLTLLRGASKPDGNLAFLAVASGIAFAAIDVWYALARVISLVYLGDAAVEVMLIGALVVLWKRGG